MKQQERVFLNSVFFVLGFTAVFSVVGILLQTVLLHIPFAAKNLLTVVGGVIIILFGIILLASGMYLLPIFSRTYKINFRRLKNSFASSFLFGIGFALGWTPCVGAILGAIYTLAATSPGIGFLLLLAFSLGLGIPFLIFGAFISRLSAFMKRIGRFLNYFNVIAGLFLLAIGVLVVTGYIGLLAVFLIGPGSMAASNQLNFLIALVAGVLTFFSPCILPLLPAYVSYMAGTTTEELRP